MITSAAEQWVDEAADLTRPSRVVWCDGSKAEYDRLIEEMLGDGTLLGLNQRSYPNCYLHRSHPQDVARTDVANRDQRVPSSMRSNRGIAAPARA